jgi:hypothetical protein
MVVPVDARRGNEAAHGKRVDQRVVEILIGEGLRGGHLARAAVGLGRHQSMACKVHAKAVFRGVAKESLGVDSAGQMVVQVRAFGHPREKRFEVERIRARGFIRAGRALLGSSRRCDGIFGRSLSADHRWQEEEERGKDRSDQWNSETFCAGQVS